MDTPGPAVRPPHFTAGVLFVAAAGVLYGTLVILGKLAYATGIAPLPLLVLRYGMAAVIMWAALALVRPDLLKLPRRDRAVSLGLGVVYATQSFAYFWGFQNVPASTTGILFSTFPLWIAILAFVFLRERFGVAVLVALAAGFAGTALTSGYLEGGGGGGTALAVALILAAAFGYAVYVVLARKSTAALRPEPVAAHVFVGAAGAFTVAAGATGGLPLSPAPDSVALALALAVVATLLPILLFLKGLRIIGAARSGVIGTLEPAVTVVLAWAIFHEALSPLQWAGGALVFAASLLIQGSGLRGKATAVPERE